MQEYRLLSTSGLLGYGFPEASLEAGMARKPHGRRRRRLDRPRPVPPRIGQVRIANGDEARSAVDAARRPGTTHPADHRKFRGRRRPAGFQP